MVYSLVNIMLLYIIVIFTTSSFTLLSLSPYLSPSLSLFFSFFLSFPTTIALSKNFASVSLSIIYHFPHITCSHYRINQPIELTGFGAKFKIEFVITVRSYIVYVSSTMYSIPQKLCKKARILCIVQPVEVL